MTSKRDFNEFSTSNSIESHHVAEQASSKKPRDTKTISDHTLWSLINNMPADLRQGALYEICKANPSSAAYVQDLQKKHLADKAAAARAAPPVNFDSYSKDCWYALNIKYKNLRSSHQYDMTCEVSAVLDHNRRAILKKARPETRWETRRNALEVLRKICKSVGLCNVQVIQQELMNTCEMYDFGESMTRLAKGMPVEERERYKKEGLYEKLHELKQLYDDYSIEDIFDELWDVFGNGEGEAEPYDISSAEEDEEENFEEEDYDEGD